MSRIGIIGGSGIYDIEGLKIIGEKKIRTPFGNPSDKLIIAQSENGTELVFLPRHGKGHRLLPSEVNSRANIWALKSLDVDRIVSISAVGSLKKEIVPKDIVIPSQIIDRTKGRPSTFFGNGLVAHVPFADPVCADLTKFLVAEIRKLGYNLHENETYVCMEGPAFSTRAESNLYRSWGAGVIGMTALPEAKLAREAGICYGIIAFATDYDCWYMEAESVSAEMVMQNFHANIEKAKNIIRTIISKLPESTGCACEKAIEGAIMTAKDRIPTAVKRKLKFLYGKSL
jgi:5'-methylthioadenosine phosphorylase